MSVPTTTGSPGWPTGALGVAAHPRGNPPTSRHALGGRNIARSRMPCTGSWWRSPARRTPSAVEPALAGVDAGVERGGQRVRSLRPPARHRRRRASSQKTRCGGRRSASGTAGACRNRQGLRYTTSAPIAWTRSPTRRQAASSRARSTRTASAAAAGAAAEGRRAQRNHHCVSADPGWPSLSRFRRHGPSNGRSGWPVASAGTTPPRDCGSRRSACTNSRCRPAAVLAKRGAGPRRRILSTWPLHRLEQPTHGSRTTAGQSRRCSTRLAGGSPSARDQHRPIFHDDVSLPGAGRASRRPPARA